MYTEDIDLYAVLQRELTGFGAAKIFTVICVLAPLLLTVIGIVKKRLDIKRFLQGAAVCILMYAAGGGLYAFVRGVSGIRVLSWCAVIFAASCVLLALFSKLGGTDGAASFFLGIAAFSVIANTVVSLMLIVSVVQARDPAYPTGIDGVCFGIRGLVNFCCATADYADFIVSGAVKVIFMTLAVFAAEKLKASEKLRKFIPAVFAVSAAVCCLGSGVFFTVLDEFMQYTKGLYMAAFGIAAICALLPLIMFIYGKVRGELEIKPFLKGIAIQTAAYACFVLLYMLIGYIIESAETDLDPDFFGIAFIIMVFGVSFALYRSVMCRCVDGKNAQSVFLGISCLTLLMLVVFIIIFYYYEVRTQYKHRIEYVDSIYYIRFMIVSAVITAASAASVFAVKRLHSSERLAGKAEYISSAMAVVLYFSAVCSSIALV